MAPDWFKKADAAWERGELDEAFRLLKDGADSGDSSVWHNLGYFYARGIGTPRDAENARYWYLRALEQGDSGSATNLGIMAVEEEDFSSAESYFRQAMSLGDGGAGLELAKLFLRLRKPRAVIVELLEGVLDAERVSEAEYEAAEKLLDDLEEA